MNMPSDNLPQHFSNLSFTFHSPYVFSVALSILLHVAYHIFIVKLPILKQIAHPIVFIILIQNFSDFVHLIKETIQKRSERSKDLDEESTFKKQ